MNIEFACKVDIGARESNDDRGLVLDQVLDAGVYRTESTPPAVAAICDGCGGYAGGGLAARTVLETLAAVPPEALADPQRLAGTLEEARRAVYARKQEFPEFAEMCTTVAGCVFCEDSTLIFHAGDSRVYRYDGVSLARMTVDHSAVQSLVDAGHMTEEESLHSPQRNIICRCIGIECEPPNIYLSHSPIQPGEVFLLCSDGFWESVPEQQIQEILSQDRALTETAERLTAQALENGSDDNISVCLCACHGSARVVEEMPFVLD